MGESIPLAERLTLYFDGSCQENRNVTAETPAGWGVVVVRGDSGLGKGDGEVVEELSGSVITSSDESQGAIEPLAWLPPTPHPLLILYLSPFISFFYCFFSIQRWE